MLSHMPDFDPERLRYAFGGAAGSLVYGVYTFVRLVKAGVRPTLSDLGRAALNVAAAAVVGIISAFILGPGLVAVIPLAGLRGAADPYAVGFGVGALGWELLPVLIEAARRVISGIGRGRAQ